MDSHASKITGSLRLLFWIHLTLWNGKQQLPIQKDFDGKPWVDNGRIENTHLRSGSKEIPRRS